MAELDMMNNGSGHPMPDAGPSHGGGRSERRHRHRSRSRDRDRHRDKDRRRRKSRSRSRHRSRSKGKRSGSGERTQRRHRGKRQSLWDVTPDMARQMGLEINPWTPSPDNPYFSAPTTPAMSGPAMAALRQTADGSRLGLGGLNPLARNTIGGSLEDALAADAAMASDSNALPLGPGATRMQHDFMHATRASKRIYVGNLPYTVSENEIRQFFNATMIAAAGPNRPDGDSVTAVYLNLQKRFAFVEFRTPQEASQAMELEGIMFRGESLKIGRPANYNESLFPDDLRMMSMAPKLNTAKLGIVSNFVPNGPNKLYCGGIPYSLTEEQVRELLSTYGALRAFHLSKDPTTGLSKGYAFFQYEDPSVTDEAIKGLNGIKIGDRQLAVRRHTPSQSATNTNSWNPLNSMINSGTLDNILPTALHAGSTQQISNVLCLLQMVTEDDLKDDNEYSEILEDVQTECSKFGGVRSVTIPRPGPNGEKPPGVGKVYVEFEGVEQCTAAKDGLQGRTFAHQTVLAAYFPAEKYAQKDFS